MASDIDERGGASKRFEFSLKGLLYFVTFLAVVLGASRALGAQVSLQFVGYFEAALFAAALVAILAPFERIRTFWPAYADPFVSVAVTVLAAASFLAIDVIRTGVHIRFDPAGPSLILFVAFVVIVVVQLAASDMPPRRERARLSPYPHAGNVVRAVSAQRFRFRLIVGACIILALNSLGIAARYSDSLLLHEPL
jgi:hypothetical protein